MKLRDARKAKGLTQHQLAEKLGVSQPMVVYWERGTERPSDDQKAKIVRCLAHPIDWTTGSPLTVNEQREMFTAIEIAAARIGWEWAMRLFANQDPHEIRILTDLVLRNNEADLLPPANLH